MEQLICCSIKIQPARSGPRHSLRPGTGNLSLGVPGVCPPPAAKRRELQWNSSSAVPSKFSQPGVARDTSLRREKNSLHRSALRGAKPVFARLWRPNGVNLHLTVASRQMNVQPARRETSDCFSSPPELADAKVLSQPAGCDQRRRLWNLRFFEKNRVKLSSNKRVFF